MDKSVDRFGVGCQMCENAEVKMQNAERKDPWQAWLGPLGVTVDTQGAMLVDRYGIFSSR